MCIPESDVDMLSIYSFSIIKILRTQEHLTDLPSVPCEVVTTYPGENKKVNIHIVNSYLVSTINIIIVFRM